MGDTAIIGAGTYCTSKVAVSMTGVGERILALLSAKRLADLLASGRPLAEAASATLAEIEGLGSFAGTIAVDASGEVAILRNTPFMAAARRP